MKKIVLLVLVTFNFSISYGQSITCDNGFNFDTQSGKLSISMNENTKVLNSYLSKSATSLHLEGLFWSDFHNAYFASSPYSTIKIYKFENGENKLSLVAKRWGYSEQQFTFADCNL